MNNLIFRKSVIALALSTSLNASPTLAGDDIATLNQEIEALKRQQQQQQQQFDKKLKRLEMLLTKQAQPTAPTAKVQPAALTSPMSGARGVVSGSASEAEEYWVPVSASHAPNTEKLWRPPPGNLPGVPGVKLTFGGFVEMAGIYRNRDLATDVGTPFQRIPFNFLPQAHFDELLASARQSRVQGLVEGDIDPNQHLGAFLAFDFLGAADTANSNESNSYNPRLREFYATYDNTLEGWHFLAGQTWALATMFKEGLIPRKENIPLTIDAQYVPGFDWLRNPSFRIVKDWDKQLWLGLELANPEAIFGGVAPPVAITTVPCISQLNPTANCALDFMPDVTAKLAWDPGWGHYEIFGLARGIRDRIRPPGDNDYVVAFSGGGGAILPVLGDKLKLQGNILAGRAIGRYTSSQLADFTVNEDGSVAPLSGISFMLGATSRPVKDLDLYLYGGQDKVFKHASGAFGYGNPNLPPSNNAGCNIEGALAATCTGASQLSSVWQITGGFWHHLYEGDKGIVQWGIQDSYTVDDASFAFSGGSPHAELNTTMLSFRYYPTFGTIVGTTPDDH